MSQAQDALIDRTFDGRYRILRRIGTGGMATVYLAEDAELGRRVAIKILNDRYAHDELFVERFRREAKSAAALSHPNIVSIYDRGEAEGTYYIAMEVIEGQNLKELIRANGRLRPGTAVAYTRQILAGLRFAHRNGIIHRDIKPHNILLGHEERLKVTDFGIARAGASQMTEAGSIMGTAQYLSPEQARGSEVAASSDLYSVGIVLYEMLTGQLPFNGDSPVEIAMKHLNETPSPPSTRASGIPADLDRIVLRSLAKNPADRYQSAEELDADLARVEAGLPVSRETATAATAVLTGTASAAPTQVLDRGRSEAVTTVPPSRRSPYDPYATRPRRRRSVLPWIVVAILLGAFSAAGWYIYQQIDERIEATAPAAVPDVEGLVQRLAVEKLESDGFVVTVEEQESGEVPAGTVIDQDPEPGSRVEEGTTVTIVVSTGVPQTEVPGVAGFPEQEARERLAASSLDVKVTEQFSNRVDAGLVISQDPKPGELVDEGTVVELRVSKGRQELAVPDVIGETEESAQAILEESGFKVSATLVYSNDFAAGLVVSQSPSGAEAPKGSTIEISVSQGPELFGLPGVIGLSADEAIGILDEGGFGVDQQSQETSLQEEDGVVLDQAPAGGESVEQGTTVTIYVGVYVAPEPPPVEPPPVDTVPIDG
jgi:serine/threonine-protein kinase